MRRKLSALLLCAVLAGALIAWRSFHHQQTYRGTSLPQWVARYSMADWHPTDERNRPAQKEQAANAIRHIGTNAIPLLLALVDNPPPGLWRRGGDLTQPLPDWIRGHPAVRWVRHHHPAVLVPNDARSLSKALGPIAKPAIPQLTQRLSSTTWAGRRDLATFALASIGPQALAKSAPSCIPMLLDDPDPFVRTTATNALHAIAPEALTNIPPH